MRPAHPHGIDFRRRRKRANRNRHVVALPARIDHVGEQKSAPLIFPQPTLELPAHQGMQLGILVDRPIDAQEQPARIERREMILEVERRPGDSSSG